MALHVRESGERGPWLVLPHGGPAAAGHMAPVARGFADAFRVLEPWQRTRAEGGLRVAHHVADLQALLEERCGDEPVAVLGSSWGAMLALAWAAAHPEPRRPLVLVGCGTFDPAARAVFQARRAAAERERGEELAYFVDPVSTDIENEHFDEQAHRETWDDMLARQADGTYPAAFAAVRAPVLMLHGADDPHPGPEIRDGLRPHLPQLEYREWPACGHFPWLERSARRAFFDETRGWLRRALAP